MFEVIEGKVQFKYVPSIVGPEYSCDCDHSLDIVDAPFIKFLEYHMKYNHLVDGNLTCPNCGTVMHNAFQETIECIECEVKQFVSTTYINIWKREN